MPPWSIEAGDGPVVATAIHSGHEVRPEVEPWLAVPAIDRLREEDPLTEFWTSVGDSAIRVFRSRFEMDLNRPREMAIASNPQDSWGLEVWREPPPEDVVARSLAQYDRFYAEVAALIEGLVARWDTVLVLDLHSYNYRRDGPDRGAADADANPELNVGTGTMDRQRWAAVVDSFIDAMRRQKIRERTLDVRENVRFLGGYFPRWLHATWPRNVCALSLEFRKFFMDEWTATASIAALDDLRVALRNATNLTRPELARSR